MCESSCVCVPARPPRRRGRRAGGAAPCVRSVLLRTVVCAPLLVPHHPTGLIVLAAATARSPRLVSQFRQSHPCPAPVVVGCARAPASLVVLLLLLAARCLPLMTNGSLTPSRAYARERWRQNIQIFAKDTDRTAPAPADRAAAAPPRPTMTIPTTQLTRTTTTLAMKFRYTRAGPPAVDRPPPPLPPLRALRALRARSCCRCCCVPPRRPTMMS